MGPPGMAPRGRPPTSWSYRQVVVDLPVVAEPQEGELPDAQRLHAVQLVHDGQPMEAEAAVGETVDVLDAEGVGASVRHLHGVGEVTRQAAIAAKHGPDTTHTGAGASTSGTPQIRRNRQRGGMEEE